MTHDPTRQIGSGIIGAVLLLRLVRSRGGTWTRSVAYIFGAVGGALLGAITLLVVFVDRHRTSNAR